MLSLSFLSAAFVSFYISLFSIAHLHYEAVNVSWVFQADSVRVLMVPLPQQILLRAAWSGLTQRGLLMTPHFWFLITSSSKNINTPAGNIAWSCSLPFLQTSSLWKLWSDSQRVEYSHLVGKSSMLSFYVPHPDKFWQDLGAGNKAAAWGCLQLGQILSSFPSFPSPLYSHTGPWEGSCCTKSKCAFSAAGVGGSEHMEAGKGPSPNSASSGTEMGVQQFQLPSSSMWWCFTHIIYRVCVFERNRRVSLGIED